MLEKLRGCKTYIVAAAAILGALGGWLGDELTTKELLFAGVAAVEAIFIRSGIKADAAKAAKAAEDR